MTGEIAMPVLVEDVMDTFRAEMDGNSHFAGPFDVRDHAFVEFEVEVDVSWEDSRNYRYSKLYFSRYPEYIFSEAQVVCFRIRENRKRHRIRIELPEEAREPGLIMFRLDPFPYAEGQARLYTCRLVHGDDTETALSEGARLDALKEYTRKQVERSERLQLEVAPHAPESLGIEIQPGCNLVCGHCSSHGTSAVHSHHNRLGAMEGARLQALADEVFPHLTMVNIVGRGEPLMVSDKLWSQLIGEAKRNRVMLSFVTNGYFIERRIRPEVLPLIDTLTVSIDGLSPETFATNRGGANFEKVIAGVRHFHNLRKAALLPRRPKLCISWTLKKNNIAELPDFVRFMAQFEPDRYYMRHLLLFHEKDAGESLLDIPELANEYLAEAYDLFARMGIETDCPPIFETVTDSAVPAQTDVNVPAAIALQETLTGPDVSAEANGRAPAVAGPEGTAIGSVGPVQVGDEGRSVTVLQEEDQDFICTYLHRTGILLAGGEMSTCGVQYAAAVGKFGSGTSFASLWNGEIMRNVRRDMNTPNEWDQCRNCWFRQSHYHAQRTARANVSAYPMRRITKFSRKAWDFLGYEDMTKNPDKIS
jgi:MoaA/NifB/PqqE/SkfB family radical SAM enzyme